MQTFLVLGIAAALLSPAAMARNLVATDADQSGRLAEMTGANGRTAGHVEHLGENLYFYDHAGKLVGIAPVPRSLNPLVRGAAEPMNPMAGRRRT